MFRYKCTIFRENRMAVLKTICLWKAFIYKFILPVAAALLNLIKYKIFSRTDFKNLWLHYG